MQKEKLRDSSTEEEISGERKEKRNKTSFT